MKIRKQDIAKLKQEVETAILNKEKKRCCWSIWLRYVPELSEMTHKQRVQFQNDIGIQSQHTIDMDNMIAMYFYDRNR